MTSTVGNSAALLEKIFDLGNDTVHRLVGCNNLSFSLSYQPVPSSITRWAASTGGNALGLDPSQGPVVLTLVTVFWADAADDNRIETALKEMFARADDEAQKMGLKRDWIYLNYAAKWQDPIGGYGAVNKRKLQEVSQKYDEMGLFQKSVPGGFKLFP